MARPHTPRSAFVLWGVSAVLFLVAALAFLTNQPNGVWSLALGLASGLNVATGVMLAEVRRGHRV